MTIEEAASNTAREICREVTPDGCSCDALIPILTAFAEGVREEERDRCWHIAMLTHRQCRDWDCCSEAKIAALKMDPQSASAKEER